MFLKNKKSISLLSAVAILVAPAIALTALFTSPVSAAAVAVVATPNELTTGGDVTFTYTAFNAVEALGTTYLFLVSPALTAATANCVVADLFADANGTDGAGVFGGFSTTGATFTTTTATVSAPRSFCLSFPNETIGSYSVAIVSSTGDFGAALVHYDDNNDILVTATVGPTLSFNIRNLADSADTNTCDLGNVTTTTVVNLNATDDGVGECGYSLAIGTNSASGFQATIDADAALNAGLFTMTDLADNAAFVAGTESYGLANVTAPGAITENTTVGFTFQTDSSPVPTIAPANFISAAAPFVYTAGVDATDVTTVMHGLTVGSATETGVYNQLVTYQVTANF
jgi:hypothetical protein